MRQLQGQKNEMKGRIRLRLHTHANLVTAGGDHFEVAAHNKITAIRMTGADFHTKIGHAESVLFVLLSDFSFG